jgi:hypothetical protein
MPYAPQVTGLDDDDDDDDDDDFVTVECLMRGTD